MFEQDKLYYERMACSIGDKSEILKYVRNVGNDFTVVDIGAGGGELSEKIKTVYSQAYVYSLDASVESIEKLKSKNLNIIHAYAHELSDVLGKSSVDSIIASSVLHEIFSYDNPMSNKGLLKNVYDFFDSSYKVLKNKGVLIIRDGIKPENDPDEIFTLTLPIKYAIFVEKFVHESPFYRRVNNTKKDRFISFNKVITDDKNVIIHANMQSLWEFIFTLNWGENSWAREVQEYYAVFSTDELIHIAKNYGFNNIHTESYFAPEYEYYLGNVMKIILRDKNGRIVPYPKTNGIYVFEKE